LTLKLKVRGRPRVVFFHAMFKSLFKRTNIGKLEVVNEQYIIDEKGRKVAVVVPLREYEELLEDLHDLAVIAERRDEPTSSFEEIKQRLRKNGLL